MDHRSGMVVYARSPPEPRIPYSAPPKKVDSCAEAGRLPVPAGDRREGLKTVIILQSREPPHLSWSLPPVSPSLSPTPPQLSAPSTLASSSSLSQAPSSPVSLSPCPLPAAPTVAAAVAASTALPRACCELFFKLANPLTQTFYSARLCMILAN